MEYDGIFVLTRFMALITSSAELLSRAGTFIWFLAAPHAWQLIIIFTGSVARESRTVRVRTTFY